MARIDRTDLPANAAQQARDPARGNEQAWQAWRKAMDGALFDLLRRDPQAAGRDSASPRPQVLHRPDLASMQADADTGTRVRAAMAQADAAPSIATAGQLAAAPASATQPIAAPAAETINHAGMKLPAALATPPAANAAASCTGHASSPATTASALPADDIVAIPAALPAAWMASPSRCAAFESATGDDAPDSIDSHEPADRRVDPALSVPADSHVFIEHTGEGAVLWMRDARGDAAALSPSLKFLLAESARQGVKVTGVRLNGRALAWPELNSIPHSDHPQGEDHGR